MAVKEDKAKVGRPKLADNELVKDSWFKIASCLSVALVMTVCTVGILTARTPLQVLTFQNPNKVQGNVSNASNVNVRSASSLGNTRIIPAQKSEKRIIDADGNVTRVIPANPVRVVELGE